MSHEAHNEEHQEGPQIDIAKSRSSFSASFWFMLILACLFIAALNFVNIMSQPEEEHGGHEGTHTEAAAHGAHGTEAASHDDAEMEGGHADAVHEPTPADDHATGAEEHTEEHH